MSDFNEIDNPDKKGKKKKKKVLKWIYMLEFLWLD